MRTRLTDAELLQLVHLVKAKCAALPAMVGPDAPRDIYWGSRDAFHKAASDLVAELVKDHGARLTKSLGGFRLAMAGVAATCTAGESGLLTNWINAAYRELDRRRLT